MRVGQLDLAKFLDDYSAEEIETCIHQAYNPREF